MVTSTKNKVNQLWNDGTAKDWEISLNEYYNAVMPNHIEIEKELEHLDFNVVKNMTVKEFYNFLYDKYFFWKYTAANRLATTRMNLQKYVSENKLDELKEIHSEIFKQNSDDIKSCLNAVKKIKGLGVAGASGLLSLLYPDKFGTVDQFAIFALLKVENIPEVASIIKMNPQNITIKDAELLINIYRRKAEELNKKYNTNSWTPRKIDQVLWSIDR